MSAAAIAASLSHAEYLYVRLLAAIEAVYPAHPQVAGAVLPSAIVEAYDERWRPAP